MTLAGYDDPPDPDLLAVEIVETSKPPSNSSR
jgi:hypothetical protein